MFCTLDSRGFRHFRAFRAFRESRNQLLVCGCLSCLRHFRHFRDSRRFREKHRIANIGLQNLGLEMPERPCMFEAPKCLEI